MSKKYILFDLDGTLTDPKAGITSSVAFALNTFGIKVHDLDTLIPFIGPPLAESFENFYGFSHDKALKAVDQYRIYFSEKGIFENAVLQGVPEMLSHLSKNGREILLATSKPEVYAQKILEHFSLDNFFCHICGSQLDGTRTAKSEVVAYALNKAGVTDKALAVMVGDRKHDIIGAKYNGIMSIGVLFGYGSEDELRKAGADITVKTVDELCSLLLQI
ncbi:MAG: HAD hydrolase-like protein [Clostridiaceae bacterium]|nr:HAD hydrolase-like protein [Clostridiaceae bacterium]